MHTTNTIRCLAVGLALALTGARAPQAEAAEPSPAATHDAGLCRGEFEYAGGDEQRAGRDAAIDAVVADMNLFARGIARSRLKKATRIVATMGIARDGKNLVVVLDGRRYSAPANGDSVEVVGADGSKLMLTLRERSGRLEEVFKKTDGGMRQTMRCHGAELAMRVTVFSPKLPRSLSYSLSYKKR